MPIQTDCQAAFFLCSSGHCSLDCIYCVAAPVVKHQPSLTADDIRFVIDSVGKKSFLAFSGSGDFFAGYKKNERLLDNVLNMNVEVALDINGVMIHEFPELSDELLRKIRLLNLTLHYRQLRDKKALSAWQCNAETVIRRMTVTNDPNEVRAANEERLVVDFIASPPEQALWQDALDFYRESVFAVTGQRLLVVRDVTSSFSEDDLARLTALQSDNADIVLRVHSEDFAARFARYAYVSCPAGKDYFRVWNDGRIEGCPFVEIRQHCGNAKKRRLIRHADNYECSHARYCDCSAIAIVNMMGYPESALL